MVNEILVHYYVREIELDTHALIKAHTGRAALEDGHEHEQMKQRTCDTWGSLIKKAEG